MADRAREAAQFVRSRCGLVPAVGIILGSGLGALGRSIAAQTSLDYKDMPHFPVSEVAGHANQLVLGMLAGRPVVAMRGRVHIYEGYSSAEVAFPVRVMAELGASVLIVSNAAGGLNQSFRAGDLMLITDHIFLPGLAGNHPLRGANDETLGPRFPPMTDAYDARLRRLAKEVARAQGLALREGIYAMVSGPSYETAAECHFLRLIGADAVGMSTAPEVVVARHQSLAVLGISLITNVIDGHPVSHEEVLSTAKAAEEPFARLVEGVVGGI
ncbi:MAG: purine-nucleoside phosphorylase, partial [Chloroflexota bacterium]|nr:purine-nucleoside phosphorylase [Chloroflexota bacterium]